MALGSFGEHTLAATLSANNREATFNTANQYHMLHALALLGVAWVVTEYPTQRIARWAGCLFALGVLLFSGSLYMLSIFNLRIMGAVAPIGGVAFLAGWALLGLAAARHR